MIKRSEEKFNNDKILIRFSGDNDFINTMIPFTKAIGEMVLLENIKLSKSDIVSLFNKHGYSFYVMYQSFGKEDTSIKEYLFLNEKDVYFNEEVDAFTNQNHDGCVVYLNYNCDLEFYVV